MTNSISRRDFLKYTALATGGILASPSVIGIANAAGVSKITQLRNRIEHVVVIFQENRSFDHYFGTYVSPNGMPVANLLDANRAIDRRFFGLQKNPVGIPYTALPVPNELPAFANVLLPNAPFHLGPYIPAGSNAHWDPKHRFFRMSAQINKGAMDRFVALALGDHQHLTRADLERFNAEALAFSLARPSGPVLGYYQRTDIPFYHELANNYTLFDHFFQAMSGGSTGNALYLVAARSCRNRHAPAQARSPKNPAFRGVDNAFFDLPYDHAGTLINDLPPIQGPTGSDNMRALKLSPPPAEQTYPNIGDRLSAAHVSWAWYNENWELVKPWALKTAFGPGDGSAIVDSGRLYEAHHNPFQYYARWPQYVRGGHIRSTNDFHADAKAGTLPGVSFLKAAAGRTEHPADSAPVWGMNWVESLVRAVADGPAWDKTAIFITYDEGGGFWDSVPPPQIDDYGLGTRTPALLVSPYAKKGFIDSTPSHTGSILRFIETRFNLVPINHRDREAYDLLNAFDFHKLVSPLKT
jgi:phospholipase C